MKVITEKQFQPLVIKLVIESEQELHALQDMASLDSSIPEVVGRDGSLYFCLVQGFLLKLQEALNV